ncbi:lipid II flippase MurJ [Mucilaginibacter phyllosphaerae]
MRKTAVILFLLRIAKLAVSIFNISLSAKYFGVSVSRDVWILAFNCMLILDAAIWGPVNETFRAKFISIKELSGEDVAIKKAKALLIFTFLLSAILVAFVMLFPQLVAPLIASTYKGEAHRQLITMLIYVAPCFFVNQATQIGISLLNAYNSFYIPEISSFLSNCLNLLLIVLFAKYIGIYSLLIAYYIGVLILLVIIIIELHRRKIPILSNYRGVKYTDFTVFILFALPFFLPYFLGQLSSIVEKNIASSLSSGAVSIIDYSRRFTDILSNVITSILTTILVPILALSFAQKKNDEFVDEFAKIYQLGFLGIISIACMFTGCPDAFVSLLYNHGTIAPEALIQIGRLAMFYGWTSYPVFVYSILGVALISSNNGKKIAFWGAVAQILVVTLNIVLVKKVGIYIFPLAMFAGHLIAAFFMLAKFPFQRKKIHLQTAKYSFIILANVILFYLINNSLVTIAQPILKILFNFGVLCLVLGLQIFIFKFDERFILIKFWRKILRYD